MKIIIRSILTQTVIYLSAPIWAILLIPFYLAPRRLAARALKAWGASALWQIRVFGGIRIEERGRANLALGAPTIIASKHQSMLDTFALTALLDDPAFVLKRELMLIPVFGWMLKAAGMIPIDREGGAKALKTMMRAAEREAAAGRPILIFPEGTRSFPGQRLPYQPGIAALYRQLKLPVVPVALNSGLFWPRRSFRKYPGCMVIEYLPPIPAGLPREEFMRRLETAIEEASERLAAAGRAPAGGPSLQENY